VKLAFVVARYGAEISHGPEHACRLIAEQLSTRHDVEVLTTCARDDETWKNEYPEGADRVRGVLVRRFAASGTRDPQSVRTLTDRLLTTPHSRSEELEWVRRVGPSAPGLIDFVKRNHRNCDALIFYSWQHATTIHGLPVAPERSILFPWLLPDPALRLSVAQETLGIAAGIGYLSATERRLLRLYTRTPPPHDEIVGIGIEPPAQQTYPRMVEPNTAPDEEDAEAPDTASDMGMSYLAGRGVPFRRRHRLHGRFVLHGGRVEPNNGCEEMIEHFAGYAKQDADTPLVLMGVKMMKLPDERFLQLAGMLPERERMVAFEAADVTVAPESDDLMAKPVLESFAVGTPVLASAMNLAAVVHARRANAGLYYANGPEFVEGLRLLMANDRLRAALGRNGRHYIRQHYRWDVVLGRFERLVNKIKGRA